MLEEVPGSTNEESLDLCRRVLEQIVGRLGTDYFFAPLAYDDPRWVSYRLAEMLPLALEEKQTLLEARDDHERLVRLHGHSEIGGVVAIRRRREAGAGSRAPAPAPPHR